MPLPPGIHTVTLTGRYTHPDGTPMRGTLHLAPTSGRIISTTTGLTIQGEATTPIDPNGDVALTVIASDADGINPTGGTYDLYINFYDAENIAFPVLLPKAAPTVQLSAITPVAPADGQYVVVTGPTGPQGPAGPQGDPGDPATNLVHSVNDQQGDVVLTAANIGADPAGTATTVVTAHSADTTDVHGIADTSALESTTGSAAKVTAHASDVDPHGDRAYTATLTNPLADRLTAVETGFTAVNNYITDALNRIASLEARMTAVEARLNGNG